MVVNENTTNYDKKWNDHEWIRGRIDRDILGVQITLSDFDAMLKHPHHTVELSRNAIEIQAMGRNLIRLSTLLLDVSSCETRETPNLTRALPEQLQHKVRNIIHDNKKH